MVELMTTTGRYPGQIEIRSSYNDKVVNGGKYEVVEEASACAQQLKEDCIVPITESVKIFYKKYSQETEVRTHITALKRQEIPIQTYITHTIDCQRVIEVNSEQ